MPDLYTHLSLADLQPFFDDLPANGDVTDAWRERYHKRLADIVTPRIAAFFRELREEGRMTRIANSEGYSCRFWNAWNRVALRAGGTVAEDDTNLESLARNFSHKLTFGITYPYRRVLKDEGRAAAEAVDKAVKYRELVDEFNQGTYPDYEFSHQDCTETGLALTLGFTSWVPEGGHIDDDGFKPIPSAKPVSVQELVLELKTGRLLVNDWFRIPAFTEVLDEIPTALGSRKGREDRTRDYAALGVICVGVGNTIPDIFRRGNTLIVGRHNEVTAPIPEQLEVVGKVCTDLWAATFVEYETLVDLVSRKLPDTAKQVVDDYLADKGLSEIQMQPGTYYLYHFGNHEEFALMAERVGLNLGETIHEPFFVLSSERLLSDA